MGPLLSLFGGENAVLTVVIALAVVLILIIFGVWALKLVFNATGRASRGHAKRLGVIDVTSVDQKRQLVLIRRDNVEHLLMVGGPQDLVIETGIAIDPVLARTPRPSRPPMRNPQSAQHAQPASPSPAVAPSALSTAASAQNVRGTNLPSDLVPARGTRTSTRGSLRHSSLLRSSDRHEPDVFPSSLQNPTAPASDSDKQEDTEPVPRDDGAGSDQPDYRDEPHLEHDGDDTRSGEDKQDS